MRSTWLYFLGMLWAELPATAQRRWDGQGADSSWQNPLNWRPDGLPLPSDTVRLDHTLVQGDYRVYLPDGSASVLLRSLQLAPSQGRQIALILPSTNTASPALQVTDTGDGLRLEAGALLKNASGASSGEPIQLNGRLRIANGATYLHQTSRGHAKIIDCLSKAPGTEEGLFAFDVPGTAGYTVSLTGNAFGSLALRAAAAGGSKSYSGSGGSDCLLRGALQIEAGASLTTTLSGNLLLQGDLQIEGLLNLSPATIAPSARSLILCGRKEQRIVGNGRLLLSASFRHIEVKPSTQVRLQRNLSLPLASQEFVVHDSATLHLGNTHLEGEGTFRCLDGATIDIGSPDGLQATGPLGNVRTRTRIFSAKAHYRFSAAGPQSAGDGIPARIHSLTVDKPSGSLTLAKPLRVTTALSLIKGSIASSSDTILSLETAALSNAGNLSNPSASGWDSSYVEGPLRIQAVAHRSLLLPLGHIHTHAPLRIELTQPTTAWMRAAYRKGPPPDTLRPGNHGLLRFTGPGYWQLLPDSPMTGIAAWVAFRWKPPDSTEPSPGWKNSLRVAYGRDAGGTLTWERAGLSSNIQTDSQGGWLQPAPALTQFGHFALAMGIPDAGLPLTAIHLKAQTMGKSIRLEWKVEGTEENAQFQIERSGHSTHFEPIARIDAADIQNMQAFSYTDDRPLPGMNLYRIKAWVQSLPTLTSPVRTVRLNTSPDLRMFPIPTHRWLHIQWPGQQAACSAEIRSVSGQTVMKLRLDKGIVNTIDVDRLTPGRYILCIWQNGVAEAHPILRMR
ncbi:MAG: T9SS type A sorting domain-containing protein [Bacteroidetes bacterium]|nr:T9SS type A sorting domain-containing protein [Bacteroidota bacterium]